MTKNQLLAKITRQLQDGPFEALQLSGIPEAKISKWIHNFLDEIECNILYSFVKDSLKPTCRSLLNLYKEQEPEYWVRIEGLTIGEPLPEVKRFKRLKVEIRKIWNSRPRFEQKRLRN